MSQLLKIRLPDGRTLTPSDWTTAEGLYSTVELPTGNISIQEAFTYGIGGTVPGSANNRQSSLIDTNLQGEGARLPENEAMIIQAIAVEVYVIPAPGSTWVTNSNNVISPDVGVSNMLAFQRDIITVLTIAAVKEYIRVPVAFLAAGAGPDSGTASGLGADGTNGYVAANNGSTSVKGLRRLASPLSIQGGEAFRLKFIPPTGTISGLYLGGDSGARLRLRAHFLGYHKRPVA
jgi:hypothetical protein